jgi:hypothetical protein
MSAPTYPVGARLSVDGREVVVLAYNGPVNADGALGSYRLRFLDTGHEGAYAIRTGRRYRKARRTTEVNVIVHSAQARETGATINVERTGPGSWIEQEHGWVTLCLNHAQLAIHDTRALAIAHAAKPSGWCGDCQAIADGIRPRITERVQ